MFDFIACLLKFNWLFRRAPESVPVLFHLHHVHEGEMGRREDPRGVRQRISGTSGGRVRTLHPRRYFDSQLSESGRRLQITAQ